MNWTAAVDIYCERTGPGLLAEPLNAITNLSFFVAAWLALRAAQARGRMDWPMRILIALTVAIGVGSTLFHTFAQRWAGVADVAPILLFILVYLFLALWRYFGARAWEAATLALAFMFFAAGLRSAAAGALPPVMDGATGYLPALLALLFCGVFLAIRRHASASWLLGATLIFTGSLTLRTLDPQLCEAFPMGTHFGWHLLNGAVLGVLMFGWMRTGARGVASAPQAA